MSMDKPPRDAMMKSAPEKKVLTEYHFAGDDGRIARVIRAHDIVEATKLYWEAEDAAKGKKEVINKPEEPAEGAEA